MFSEIYKLEFEKFLKCSANICHGGTYKSSILQEYRLLFVLLRRSGRGEQKHEYMQIVESRREGAMVP